MSGLILTLSNTEGEVLDAVEFTAEEWQSAQIDSMSALAIVTALHSGSND